MLNAEIEKSDLAKLDKLMVDYSALSSRSMVDIIRKSAVVWLRSARKATPTSKNRRRAYRNKGAPHGSPFAYLIETFGKNGQRWFVPAPSAKHPSAIIKYKGAAKGAFTSLIQKVSKRGGTAKDPLRGKFSKLNVNNGTLPFVEMISQLYYIQKLNAKHNIEGTATLKARKNMEFQLSELSKKMKAMDK